MTRESSNFQKFHCVLLKGLGIDTELGFIVVLWFLSTWSWRTAACDFVMWFVILWFVMWFCDLICYVIWFVMWFVMWFVILWFAQPGRGGLQHACFCRRALSPPRCKDQRFYEKNCERIFCKEVDPEENEPTLLMREVLFPMAKLCGNNVDWRHLVKGTSHLGSIC